MTQKTYGVYGLMEWEILAAIGKRTIKIDFKGGITTRFGVTPATYTTANPIVQHAIETTAYFRSGRIKVVKAIQREEVASANATKEQDKKADLKTVKVACIDDARDYLIVGYKVAQSKLRTKAAITEQAALVGIRFEGI